MKKNFFLYFTITTAILIFRQSLWAEKHLPPIQDFEIETEESLDPFFIELIRNNQGFFLEQYLIKMPHLIQLHASESGRTLLHIAVEYEKQDIINLLLSMQLINTNPLDNNEVTPLLYAARQGSITSIEKLLNAGADKNHKDSFGLGVIHYSLMGENFAYSTTEYLINKKVNLNEQDIRGDAPLHYAIQKSIDLILLLLKSGANPDITNNSGNRPMHDAALINNTAAITALISYKGLINVTNRYGYTPLHHALAKDNYGAAQLLVEKGAHINLHTANKPFIFFVIKHCTEAVPGSCQMFKQLLEKGMNPYDLMRTKQGIITAREYAIQKGKFLFAEIIRSFCNKTQLKARKKPHNQKILKQASPFTRPNISLFFAIV